MWWQADGKMIRTAVFFDGGYFDEVSRYYKFHHLRVARLSIDGILEFVRDMAAEREKVDQSYCQVVEAHYFRGRFSAADAEAAGKLKDQAVFDEVLIRAGIIQHYLPIVTTVQGKPRERGIDVWLSLEAFDLAVHKRFDVLALVACDGDYVPLVRKLAGIGIRTMLLAWDFKYEYEPSPGKKVLRETRTAQVLINCCTYPIMMAPIIDDRSKKDDPLIKGLFVT